VAGRALELCAAAVEAATAAVAAAQRQRGGSGDGPGQGGGTHRLMADWLVDLTEAASPQAGRLPAAQAALKATSGRGVALGSGTFLAARRGAVAQPLLSARLAAAMAVLRLARWAAAAEPATAAAAAATPAAAGTPGQRTPGGGGKAGAGAPAPAAAPSPAAPLLLGLLRLHGALAGAWRAVDRAALFAGAPAHRGPGMLTPLQVDATRCEQLLEDVWATVAAGGFVVGWAGGGPPGGDAGPGAWARRQSADRTPSPYTPHRAPQATRCRRRSCCHRRRACSPLYTSAAALRRRAPAGQGPATAAPLTRSAARALRSARRSWCTPR
jgi:hypothetical protein